MYRNDDNDVEATILYKYIHSTMPFVLWQIKNSFVAEKPAFNMFRL